MNDLKTLCDLKIEFKRFRFIAEKINFSGLYFPNNTSNNLLLKKFCGNKVITFIAHYDIVNKKSDNCLDNSASIINLLSIIDKVEDVGIEINFLFTNGEETGGTGIAEYIKLIKADNREHLFINLELSAFGKDLWIEYNENFEYYNLLKKSAKFLYNNIEFLRCPFNDAIILRENKLQAITIGTAPKEFWDYCHNIKDKFELANADDMLNFQNFLLKIISEYSKI